MPILDLSNLADRFSVGNSNLSDFASFVASGSDFYSYLSSDGNLVTLTGTGITVDGSNMPATGTITGVTIDIGNDNTALPDAEITGLSFAVTSLNLTSGSIGSQSFWDTVLTGQVEVIAPPVVTHHIQSLQLAGDGISYTGARYIAADDSLESLPTLGGSSVYGDFLNTHGGFIIGGDDLITGGFSWVAGEVHTLGSGATILAGNDVIRWTYDGAVSESYGPTVYGDVYNVAGGLLVAGHDTLDLSAAVVSGRLFGDIEQVSTLSTVVAGNDLIRGGQGNANNRGDTIFGDAERVHNSSAFYSGSDTIFGEDGNDTIVGDVSEVNVYAEFGFVEGADDWINGGIGNDIIYGDYLLVNTRSSVTFGNDTLLGGEGDDTIYGDVLVSTGNPTAIGGNDLLMGGAGDDSLYGNGGDDTLNGGAGADNLMGGEGLDWADYSQDMTRVGVRLDGGVNFAGASGDSFDSIENVIGSDFNDTIVGSNGDNHLIGGAGTDVIFGRDGNDTLEGGMGDDTLQGQNGDDLLLASLGNDILDGGLDQDTVDYGNMTRGAGIRLDGASNFGAALGHTIRNVEHVNGSDFNDVIVGHGADNRFETRDGNDTIYALGGNDTLIGGAGDDVLFGQGGSDQFIFEDGFGDDTINGFATWDGDEDIDLSGVAEITDFTDLQTNHMTQVGADVVIDDGLGNTITLTNTNIVNLDATDFVF